MQCSVFIMHNVKASTATGDPDTQAATGGLIRSPIFAFVLVVWYNVVMLLSVGNWLYESYAMVDY